LSLKYKTIEIEIKKLNLIKSQNKNMQKDNITNKQSNKTTNLSRAIMMLAKNADANTEKTLLAKIETACYELIDTAHNNREKVADQLSYIYDLMLLARQVNLFLEENTVFIISVISEISKSYETKLEVKNEEMINEKIRDILQGGEMSETESIDADVNMLDTDKRQKEIKREVRSLEKSSETKNERFKIENKNGERLENANVKDIKNIVSNYPEIKKDINTFENSRKLSRREEVLKVLSKVPVSIKDVSEKVLGCSEKTLQRELNTLVDLNLAARIGEKRWSRYVLA
jgi:hypothetical protein